MSSSATPPSLRPFFRGLLAAVILVPLSILGVDRAAATWSHATWHGTAVFTFCKWLTWIVEPIPWAVAASLAAAALAGARGWRPGYAGKTWIACGVSTAFAIVMKEQLKLLFGRTWPESWVSGAPGWIGDHAFGFHFMHGGSGWLSFPSGHMTVITASMAVLWRRAPRFRWIWGSLIAIVAIGLLGTNFHFVGDMIAGTFLGAACAAGTLVFVD